MKKHWIEHLPEHQDTLYLKLKLIAQEMKGIREYNKTLEEMLQATKNQLESYEQELREFCRQRFTEDQITQAIGKAMIDEINQRQNHSGQSITFTNVP